MKMKSRGKEKKKIIYDKRKLLFVPYCWCGYSSVSFQFFILHHLVIAPVRDTNKLSVFLHWVRTD